MLVSPTIRYSCDMDFDQAPRKLKTLPSWLINQAALQASRLVKIRLATADARRYDFSLLSALGEFGPASQIDLGRRCGIDRSDVVAILGQLTESRFVARTPDESDRRRNIVTLTKQGERHLAKLSAQVDAAQEDLLEPLSDNERRQLIRLLTKVVGHHAAASTRAASFK